jgi:UDPglucose 6-dehydrogenase
MNITVIGSGYVGLVTGTCLSDMGNNVICFDINKDKINELNKGKVPFYEPDLPELVGYNLRKKRLSFTDDPVEAIQKSTIIFIAVGTPPNKNGSTNMTFIKSAAKSVGQHLNGYKVIVTKSTVPVGTNELIKKIIQKENKRKFEFSVVSNPEFLREGSAVQDFYAPDRIILGFEKNDTKAKKIMLQLYQPIAKNEKPIVITDLKTSEITKYAANSFLVTKISFINEMANFCEKVGANIDDLAKGIGLDDRIGPKFLQAGLGYGGSCFPKDTAAVIWMGKKVGYKFKIIQAAKSANQEQKFKVVEKLYTKIKNLNYKTITIWGVSFKPNTDDTRESPAVEIVKKIINDFPKIKINIFDPRAMENFKKEISVPQIKNFEDMYLALENSSAILILTDWDEFKSPDLAKMKKNMKQKLIIDDRNMYNPDSMKDQGFEYLSIGRK